MKQIKTVFINVLPDSMKIVTEDMEREDSYKIFDYIQSVLDTYLPNIKYQLVDSKDNELPFLILLDTMFQDIKLIINILNNKIYNYFQLAVYSES